MASKMLMARSRSHTLHDLLPSFTPSPLLANAPRIPRALHAALGPKVVYGVWCLDDAFLLEHLPALESQP